jgi:GNAT superfamily N-acetyltransferase
MNASKNMQVAIQSVNFSDASDVEAYVEMVNDYSRDPMGNGKPLDPAVLEQLGPRVTGHPGALGWLAWNGDEPVGVLTAFLNFSTFAARPRINIHDIAVAPGHRNLGIGWKLLEAAESYAVDTDCCALTLEVRADNARARHLYEKFGFVGATDWTPPDTLAFWKKTLA